MQADLSDYDTCVKVLRDTYAGQKDISIESLKYGKEFVPSNKDIIINSGAKSGTIWVGWIIFLLKCKCDPVAIEKISQNEDFIAFIPGCYDYQF